MPGPAHPRSRGEHRPESAAHWCTSGSSPLARGTYQRRGDFEGLTRLIPARAGNIHTRRVVSSPRPAHPRSRGEHAPPIRITPMPHGSSPLARGTLSQEFWEQVVTRLIPARAGNIRRPHAHKHSRPAHPRSRGEHCGPLRRRPGFQGSSPLARGTWVAVHRRGIENRLIPARAGNIRAIY